MQKVGKAIGDVGDHVFDVFHENDFKKITLNDYRGKWVVLLFYPADFTFVCPTELEEAAAMYADFQKEGAEVISVSTDTHFSHKAWHDTSPAIGKLSYPMLADPCGVLCRFFDTYIEKEGISLRATCIIDPDGVLKSLDIHDNSIGRNTQEILRRVQAARFVREHEGLVCPASWQPGKETLKPNLDIVGKI